MVLGVVGCVCWFGVRVSMRMGWRGSPEMRRLRERMCSALVLVIVSSMEPSSSPGLIPRRKGGVSVDAVRGEWVTHCQRDTRRLQSRPCMLLACQRGRR